MVSKSKSPLNSTAACRAARVAQGAVCKAKDGVGVEISVSLHQLRAAAVGVSELLDCNGEAAGLNV